MNRLKVSIWLLTVIAGTWITPSIGRAQSSTLIDTASGATHYLTSAAVCADSTSDQSVRAALRRVCLQQPNVQRALIPRNAIVIGFVGGFVKRNNKKHPEVQFAEYLRQSYPSAVHAEVFANHDGKHALARVLQLLEVNGDGNLTPGETQQATIIIYGHSWGASQAVTLARDLELLNIPVSLMILVDSVHKPGHQDGVIPVNVRSAVNFYQTRGFIHGRSRIRAADPDLTDIIGNFEMKYQDRQIKCDNYPWIVRHLNRGHHEIENDPLVWEQIALMIDAELSTSATPELQAASPAYSLVPLK